MLQRTRHKQIVRVVFAGAGLIVACLVMLSDGSTDAQIAWAAGTISFILWVTLR
jgi:hypothetical protein